MMPTMAMHVVLAWVCLLIMADKYCPLYIVCNRIPYAFDMPTIPTMQSRFLLLVLSCYLYVFIYESYVYTYMYSYMNHTYILICIHI